MKKKLLLSAAIALSITATIGATDVYAGGFSTPVKSDKELFEAYPGETFETNWEINYGGPQITGGEELDDTILNFPMTDFEFSVRPALGMNYDCLPDSYYRFTSAMEGANISTDGRVYYTQIMDQKDKTVIPAHTVIATTTTTIPNDYNDWEDRESFKQYSLKPILNIVSEEGIHYDDVFTFYPEVKILKYKVGDINRDHEVDYYDAIEMIRLIYQEDEDFVWNKNVYQAAKIFDTFSEEELENMEDVIEPGFFDLINLIEYIYNENTITYNLNGGEFDSEFSEAPTRFISKETPYVRIPQVSKDGAYLDYVIVSYTRNGEERTEYLPYFEYMDTMNSNYEITYVWSETYVSYEKILQFNNKIALFVNTDGTLKKPNGELIIDDTTDEPAIANAAYLYNKYVVYTREAGDLYDEIEYDKNGDYIEWDEDGQYSCYEPAVVIITPFNTALCYSLDEHAQTAYDMFNGQSVTHVDELPGGNISLCAGQYRTETERLYEMEIEDIMDRCVRNEFIPAVG